MAAERRFVAACAYGLCDGSGMIIDWDANETYRCRCWPEQVQRRRSRRLSHAIPRKFRNLGFDREPIPSIERSSSVQVRAVRQFCERIDEMLDRGEGMWFLGSPGTGKSHLAYLISQHALAAGRSVAIYSAPRLMDEIRATYDDDRSGATLDLIDRLTTVELLHIEDLAVARPTDWVLEQLYNIINGRYENEKSIVFTCDLTAFEDDNQTADPFDARRLAARISERNFSRLMEMCGDPIPMMGTDHRFDARPQ